MNGFLFWAAVVVGGIVYLWYLRYQAEKERRAKPATTGHLEDVELNIWYSIQSTVEKTLEAQSELAERLEDMASRLQTIHSEQRDGFTEMLARIDDLQIP
jgi:hypothetical protein